MNPFKTPTSSPKMRSIDVSPHFFVSIFKNLNKNHKTIFIIIKIPMNKMIFMIIFDNIGANISPQVIAPSKVILFERMFIITKVAIFKFLGRPLNNSSMLLNSPTISPSNTFFIKLYNMSYKFPPKKIGLTCPTSQYDKKIVAIVPTKEKSIFRLPLKNPFNPQNDKIIRNKISIQEFLTANSK